LNNSDSRGAARTVGALRPPPERSGVLHPARLERFRARRHEADAAIASVVEWFWTVDWHLDPGETVEQRIVPAPAVHVTIENGDVPAPLVITGPYRHVWTRTLRGTGSAFGIRLRPGGLGVLSDRSVADVVDATVPVSAEWAPRLHAVLTAVADESTTARRIEAATAHILAALEVRSVSARGRLADTVLTDLAAVASTIGVRELAERNGVSERTMQRALRETTGFGPKWAARVVRLQRAIAELSEHPDLSTADLAYRLGYADQSHLIGEFRAVTGQTPGEYVQSLAVLQN